MSIGRKVWLIVGVSLIILGLIIFAAAMTANKWDFTKLSTVKFETNTYSVSDEFDSIAIQTDTADIIFVPTDDGICRVVCYEEENIKHSVAVQNNILTIQVVDKRAWYEYIGITYGTPKITVYLPQREYTSLHINESTGDVELPKEFTFGSIDISASTGDVKCHASTSDLIKIKLNTGDINVENISAGALDLTVSTGKVTAKSIVCNGDININVSTGKTYLTDVKCESIISNGSTGDISLKNVIAEKQFSIKRNTGDVMFEGCDAAEIHIETSTGAVKGSLMSSKVFIVESDTGRVNVPKTVTGGRCEITTDTGDIKISILN